MRLVPGHIAELACGASGHLLAGYGVAVGSRIEIDTDRMRKDGHDRLAALIDTYHIATITARTKRPARTVQATVLLRSVRQTDREGDRHDLAAEVRALETTPLATAADILLSADPDPAQLEAAGEPYRMKLGVDGRNSTASFHVRGVVDWPAELGGASWPEEAGRTFILTVNRAAWRDRKIRRLVNLDIHAEMTLPEPPADPSDSLQDSLQDSP